MELELRHITKRFGDFTANDSIDLTVAPGEIHALLGENGAGKSTLMNVLYGLYQADEGQIFLDGKAVHFSGPGDAMAAGIGMVHQHFMLVPVFSVAENVCLGSEPLRKPTDLINLTEARKLVKDISDRFGFDVDPDAMIEDLPVGVQQRVEIIKALSRRAEVLILDEPTAVLTPQETDELMAIMRQLAASGTSIVFITHKLREVQEVADKITVIRRGKVVGQANPSSTQAELASLMVGRPVSLTVDKSPANPGEVALELDGVFRVELDGRVLLDNVSLEVRKGEVLAIAGVQGNGQTELAECLLGLAKPTKGSISLGGQPLAGLTVRRVLDSGVGFVPEDRSTDGMVGEFSIAENLVLDQFHRAPFSKAGSLRVGVIGRNAKDKVAEFDVRTTSVNDPIASLSGGNQQKVVLARELSRDLRLLVAAQPTRGLDVGSIEFVHQQIVVQRDKGVPVVIIATELDEVEALADRIAVMYRGRVVGIVPGGTDRETLGLMMAGVTGGAADAATPPAGNQTDNTTQQLQGDGLL